jgi:hypothetical protein
VRAKGGGSLTSYKAVMLAHVDIDTGERRQHLPGKGMSSISSAQEPRSAAISHVPVRGEVSEPTLVGQEVPEGHLLGLLLSGRYTKSSVSIRSPN